VLLCTIEDVECGLCSLEASEVMRCVLLNMLEAEEGGLCSLEAPEVMRCVLIYILEAVEGGLCSLEAPEVMRCVLLYMLEVVEQGEFCSLEASEAPGNMRSVQLRGLGPVEGELCLLEVLDVLEVPEVMHRIPL